MATDDKEKGGRLCGGEAVSKQNCGKSFSA